MNLRRYKVVFFLEDLDGGGAERAIIDTANLIAKEYVVELVVGYATSVYRSELNKSVSLVDFNTRNKLHLFRKFRKCLKNSYADVVFSSLDFANYLTLFCAIITRYKGKIIFSQRAALSNSKINIPLFNKIVFFLAKVFLSWRIDLIASNSQFAISEIKKDFFLKNRKIFYLPNVINFDLWSTLSKDDAELEMIRSFQPYILAVGSIIQRKDYYTLIKAFSLTKDFKGKLIILGKGYEESEYEKIKSLIEELSLNERIFMLGFKANPYPWISNCELMVSSSLNEGFPNSIIQALVLGKKVVATDCPGDTAYILKQSKNSILVPMKNDLLLSSAIRKLLNAKFIQSDDVFREYNSKKIFDTLKTNINSFIQNQ